MPDANELNKTRNFVYDSASNLVERTDRLGRKTIYEYDSLHRLTAENWLDGSESLFRTLSYVYDAAGQLLTASDPAASYDYDYDGLGRVTAETQTLDGLSFDIEYESQYDANHNRTGLLALIDGTADFENTYFYDGLSRLISLAQQGTAGGHTVAEKRIDVSYNDDGAFKQIDRYADIEGFEFVAASFYTYDGIGRLTKLTHNESSTAGSGWGTNPLAGYQFTYDAASRITSIDSYVDGLSQFSYDLSNQLTAADHASQSDETYSYDENGNRTMSGYSTTDNNQLASDGVYNYEYDDEGNRTAKEKISTGEREEYEWDHRNRLTGVTFKNSSDTVTKTVEHTYDLFNRWVRRSVDPDGATGSAALIDTFFSHFDGQIALQFDGDDPSDLTHRYLWGPAIDQILADESVDSLLAAGDVLWPLTDHLGTPRDLASYDDSLNETSVENHRVFNSFGQLIAETNGSVTTLVGFTGVFFDTSTSLNYHRARWLDLPTGRWLSEDPIGFIGLDPNLARYVANAPTTFIDSNGLRRSGHHIIPWSIFHGKVSEEVAKFFDSDEARIFNEFYKEHNYKELNGVKHSRYNELVLAELKDFLGDKQLCEMSADEAKQFLERIKNKGGDIGKYLEGVRKEADDALQLGLKKAAKQATSGASEVGESALGRLGRKGKGALPGFLGLAVTGFFFPGQVEAKGLEGAVVDEALDSVPILDWFKVGTELVSGKDWIPDKTQEQKEIEASQRAMEKRNRAEYERIKAEQLKRPRSDCPFGR